MKKDIGFAISAFEIVIGLLGSYFHYDIIIQYSINPKIGSSIDISNSNNHY